MSSGKTNKAFSKRITVTKNGKLRARKAGHAKLKAKESRSKQLGDKRSVAPKIKNKTLKRYMPHS